MYNIKNSHTLFQYSIFNFCSRRLRELNEAIRRISDSISEKIMKDNTVINSESEKKEIGDDMKRQEIHESQVDDKNKNEVSEQHKVVRRRKGR